MYQNLFNALSNVCGFTALESDMQEIIAAHEKDLKESHECNDDLCDCGLSHNDCSCQIHNECSQCGKPIY